MGTTTIRVPDNLKTRISKAAGRAATNPHNFILEAIAEQAEHRGKFDAMAEERYARIVEAGKTILWREMRSYLEGRMTDKVVKRLAVRRHEIVEAIGVLEANPLIGRPAESGKRELVSGRHSHAHVALYRYVAEIDTTFVLAIRAQREAGFGRE